MEEWKEGSVYRRNDGNYYQAEGNEKIGYVRLFDVKGAFQDKFGYGFPNLIAADAVCRILADAFNTGWSSGRDNLK